MFQLRHSSAVAVKWSALVTMAASVLHCSASSGSDTGAPAPITPTSGGGGNFARGGNSAQGGTAATAGQGFIIETGGLGGIGPDAGCGSQTVAGERITETRIETRIETRVETRVETHEELEPVAIYIMLDQSRSMLLDKWTYAVDAISGFANDPSSQGLDVGLGYFPLATFPCLPQPNDCTGDVFVNPEVPFGRIDATGNQSTAVTTNLTTLHGPCGSGTPIEPALRGVTQGCIDFEAANPGEDCVALFITDGTPSSCDWTVAGLSAIAASALQQGVETYTVGMPGADYNLLDAIAAAGNTDCDPGGPRRACDASSTGEFSAALARIRDSITTTTVVEVPVEVEVEYEVEVPVEVEVIVPLECEWGMPRSDKEQDIDEINVDFTDRGTGSTTRLGRVMGEADCPAFANGWYYDDPVAPTKILACPDACDAIKAADARIDILVGCKSTPAIPR